MKYIEKICTFYDHISKLTTMISLGSIFLLTIVNAALRYCFSVNLLWAYDWLRVLFLFFVFFAIPIIYKMQAHAKFVFLESKFTPFMAYCVHMVTYFLSAILFAVVVWKGLILSFSTRQQILPASGISAMWLYLPLVFGMAVTLHHTLLFIVQETAEQLDRHRRARLGRK